MVQVEGVARGIDPSHDIWAAAEPIVRGWTTRELGPAGAAKLAMRNAREVTDRLKRLPQVMDSLESALQTAAQPPARRRERFAPWWGWFIFLTLLAMIAGIVIITSG